ncbi:MAG TPA: peptide deformylase [Candidatus Saccharimonadales bacterium]|nr:peptide deformylase [Candidatus Saccharimonadales bacterium]
MNVLAKTEFGNPILREVAKKLTKQQIVSPKVQSLIKDMRHTLITQKLGIGLAAPQIGQSLALSTIAIRPTAHRKKVEPFDIVIINPEISQHFAYRKSMWEGCLSGGKSGLFAKVPRYKKIELVYHDEYGKRHTRIFEGLEAQVIQHEVDHLNGVLFVDRVKDPKTYMTLKEYKKRVVTKKNSKMVD